MRRDIEAAISEHANASIETVGKPKTGVARWVALVAAVATAASIMLPGGATVSAQIDNLPVAQPIHVSESYRADDYGIASHHETHFVGSGAKSLESVMRKGAIPVLTDEFQSAAVTALQHNAGLDLNEADALFTQLQEIGAECVKEGGRNCRVKMHGVDMDFTNKAFMVTLKRMPAKEGAHADQTWSDLQEPIMLALQQGEELLYSVDESTARDINDAAIRDAKAELRR